jgi:hypothetical protein
MLRPAVAVATVGTSREEGGSEGVEGGGEIWLEQVDDENDIDT